MTYPYRRARLRTAAVPCLLAIAALSVAAEPAAERPPQAKPLAFTDFFKHPIGARGLEPGARLLGLAGERVELSGYLVHRSDGAGPLILAPVPVALGDEDEGLADDLPAAVAYLHPTDARIADALATCHGALRVRGRMDIGRMAEDDGRQSFVRLQADAVQCVSPRSR